MISNLPTPSSLLTLIIHLYFQKIRNDPGRVTLLGTDLVVTGWGQITKDERITEENFEDINPSAKTLKKGTVPHIDYRQCSTPQINEYFNGENVLGKNIEVDVNLEICAGGDGKYKFQKNSLTFTQILLHFLIDFI